MLGGKLPVMLPAPVCSRSAPNRPLIVPVNMLPVHRCISLLSSRHNTPEEDDETMSSEKREASHMVDATTNLHGHPRLLDHGSVFSRQRWSSRQEDLRHPNISSFGSSQPPHSLPAGFTQPTPFPSQVSWLHSSLNSSWSGYPNSLPSCLSQKHYPNCCEDRCKSLSLPGQRCSNTFSLEQPLSLHSNPPSAELYHHTLSPYSGPPAGPACCAQCPAEAFSRRPIVDRHAWPPCSQYYPGDYRLPGAGFTQLGPNIPVKERRPAYSTPLSLEQRRVFVTYEADNDKHVNEIINFVALLRHNGFDTHIDIFEQQFRSISKIDFMERYLSEKEYLIIIIISPKYFETVTAPPFDLENDERTFNTVYIHKQLQNEFIQNGSKNFRFIPVLFPGAKKCHVPNWLQNTHIFAWPRDRDDILRRLMRVEKYHPPPIGDLPTIVSVPI
nr:E3 ubiquitin ligase TRAF3IP2 isoform X1 [Nothobranchius furzeri]XP_054590772.1 E3 ubiquitin ligase TRAF3IP2 isoform X1 [Nothobranchius furzeri]XP_054590773.1 E3 ubiquitin ligase TRAF3IP2 isoform X1 [Nothobranchius furzeri]XP_054590774.1 E3 ubiquitin ligase TRAF3IP2 isoform X1 [Nothobranchius furzeri]XP_054590775.1 E3 ubiquitin ligase TRAF3IP2 isoform X1 [Nothobranchius furzeri]